MDQATNENSADLKRLFRIFKTVVQMMMDRGYYVLDMQRKMEFLEFESQFKDKTRDAMTMVFMKREDESQKIYIFFAPTAAKFTKDELKSRAGIMTAAHVTNGIIILRGDTSPGVTEQEGGCSFEFFKEEELLVNITEHELVPRHILISPEDKLELLKRYKVKESQLPKILLNDPVARYYGLKRNDVVKIVRESETAGKYVTYRLVC